MMMDCNFFPLYTWDVHPVAFHLLDINIRWYGIFFASGVFLLSIFIEKDKTIRSIIPQSHHRDLLLSYAILFTILGAKLGYIFLYTPYDQWIRNFFASQGFSFHGGLLGFLVYTFIFAHQYKGYALSIIDRFAVWIPWSLALGRIGNFFNSELIGRPTYRDWGIVFPYGDPSLVARHPSQIYEALGEGVILGFLMLWIDKILSPRAPGVRCSLFIMLLYFDIEKAKSITK
jgi:phosphatidylglycerol:prolipoprotein diacylglycerol transferase